MTRILTLFLAVLVPLAAVAGPAAESDARASFRGNSKSLELNEQGAAAVQAKDFTKAEELFNKALQIDAGNLSAAFNLAGMYLLNNKTQRAIDLLKNYSTMAPKDPEIRVRLGDAYLASKKIKEATQAYEEAFQIEKNYPPVSAKLAEVYALQNRLQDAEKMLTLATTLSPKNADLLSNLSALLLANGKPQDAITAAKQALQLKPTSGAYITMGSAYEKLHDQANATIAFQRAADLGDKSPGLKEKLESLKNTTK